MTAPQVPGGFPLRSTSPPGDRSAGSRPVTAPLAIWLLLQLAALFLAALRIPLSDRYPLAGERLAIHLLLFTQIVGSASLAPMLLRDRAAVVATMLTAWPMLAVAAVLSAVPPGRAALGAVILLLWLAALAGWRVATPRAQAYLTVLANVWSVGGPVLWYLRSEFASSGGGMALDWGYGPVFIAFQNVDGTGQSPGGGLILLILAIAGAIAGRVLPRSRDQDSG